MKLAKNLYPTHREQSGARLHAHFSTLLALAIIFSLMTLAIHPAAAQAPSSPEAGQAFWNLQTIDDPPLFTDMTDRSARFDASGNPHIAFGEKHLYYTRWNPNTKTWFLTTIDFSPKVGRYASLGLNSLGNPFIAYYDEANGALKFAYSLDGGYNWNPPQTIATFGPAPTATFDPANPTIEQALKSILPERTSHNYDEYLQQANSPDAIQETGVGGYTSTAVDSQNMVHISYYDWTDKALMYTRWDGVSWTTPVMVDGNPAIKEYDVGKYSSIAVDKNGQVHISYFDDRYENLRYATGSGNSWDTKVIDEGGYPNFAYGGFTSIVLDSEGNPYISYQDWVNYNLLIASPSIGGSCSAPGCRVCGESGNWQCRIVDSNGATGLYTSIGLSGGELRISYYNASQGDLMYAESSNGRSWSIDVLASSGDTGQFTSLATDNNGYPGISYYSWSSGLLSFIRWTGDGWSNSGIVYAGELLPTGSLGISRFDVPYVSYFNDLGDQLKLPFSMGYGWYGRTVTSGAGGMSSVKITQSGEPRIALYNDSSADLVYAYPSGGGWAFQTVDSADSVGLYPSLALDSQDRPFISYYDVTNGNLKFAYWNGSQWVVQVVDAASADVGTFNSLTLSKNTGSCNLVIPNSSVCPMISYYDATNTDLKHAFLSVSAAWVNQVVDSSGEVGQYSSIGIDNFGQLHISYYDKTNGDLKHAVGSKGGSSWSWPVLEVVDSNGDVGRYSSLGIDSFNTPHISYYDATLGDLKYATLSGIWLSEVVDSFTDTGISTSLSFFSGNQPGISYYDASNGAMRFATTFTGLYGKPYFLPVISRNN